MIKEDQRNVAEQPVDVSNQELGASGRAHGRAHGRVFDSINTNMLVCYGVLFFELYLFLIYYTN